MNEWLWWNDNVIKGWAKTELFLLSTLINPADFISKNLIIMPTGLLKQTMLKVYGKYFLLL